MTSHDDGARVAHSGEGDSAHNIAGSLGQIGRTGGEGTAGTDGDPYLASDLFDLDQTLAELLAQGDGQEILGDSGAFGFLPGLGLLLFEARDLGLTDIGFRLVRGGGQLRQLLLEPAEQHLAVGGTASLASLGQGLQGFLDQAGQVHLLGVLRREVDYDFLAEHFD